MDYARHVAEGDSERQEEEKKEGPEKTGGRPTTKEPVNRLSRTGQKPERTQKGVNSAKSPEGRGTTRYGPT
ncbi:hypothetical protein NDU88_002420 [Pleurodeles waltl]|uniref:Uncharacterized protein n=1 Tax=Pleurodeles waltl TaxID=8319 RepID=A0AAV7SCQ2_PLEWA|nr:hypothetical protein NDU88_002420 [Pleurodeles waltl]